MTNQIKGYPFEVLVPPELPVQGVILSDQVKSLDWTSRKAEYVCTLPELTVNELQMKLVRLLA